MTKVLPTNDLIRSCEVRKVTYGPFNHSNKTGSNYATYVVNYSSLGRLPDRINLIVHTWSGRIIEDYHWHTSVNNHYGYRQLYVTKSSATIRVYNLNTSSTVSCSFEALFLYTDDELR